MRAKVLSLPASEDNERSVIDQLHVRQFSRTLLSFSVPLLVSLSLSLILPLTLSPFVPSPPTPPFAQPSLTLKSRNVMSAMGIFPHEDCWAIVMERMECSLRQRLRALSSEVLCRGRETVQQVKLALDCAMGVETLHAGNMVHRNIKSSHFLIGLGRCSIFFSLFCGFSFPNPASFFFLLAQTGECGSVALAACVCRRPSRRRPL